MSPSLRTRNRTWTRSLVTLALVAGIGLSSPARVDAQDPPGDRASSASSERSDALDISSLLVPKAGYGFADGMKLVLMSPDDLERQLDAVSLTDARWLRVPFNWARIEPTEGTYDWSEVDRVVDRARAHGLKILANLAYAPEWARGPSTTASAPPSSPRLYGAFAAAAAEHFAGRVKHWEIWNEPNFAKYFGGESTHATAPEIYTKLLKKAYRAIKAERKRSTVVAGALAPGADDDEGYSMPTFVRRMYEAGARRFFDAISLHPYTTTTSASWTRVYGDVAQVRTLMVQHRNSRRKIWYTELGHTTPIDGLSQVTQAAWVTKELALAAEQPYIGPAFLYAIRDSGPDASQYSQNFGTLLTYDFQPKLLATVLATTAALP
ncbi:hypothetical protein BH09ACT12_BH09ACT12_19470 [soil metagenome]